MSAERGWRAERDFVAWIDTSLREREVSIFFGSVAFCFVRLSKDGKLNFLPEKVHIGGVNGGRYGRVFAACGDNGGR